VTVLPPISTSAAAPLGKVSVVMMARAAARAVGGQPGTRSCSASVILLASSGSPITPVDAVKTCSGGIPTACAVAVGDHVDIADARPRR
jgi:hypothetical protein